MVRIILQDNAGSEGFVSLESNGRILLEIQLGSRGKVDSLTRLLQAALCQEGIVAAHSDEPRGRKD